MGHYPLDEGADKSLEDSFNRLAVEVGKNWERLEINKRYLTCRRFAEGVAWFDFAELCDGPRSQNDYIELARIFNAVLISGVVALTLSPMLSSRVLKPAGEPGRFEKGVEHFFTCSMNFGSCSL